jgi:nicotinamidase/pyrazinamidase
LTLAALPGEIPRLPILTEESLMPRVIFWDVDTQYDFMRADGKLYVPDAEQLIPNLKKLTDYAHGHGIRVVASADDHVREHAEISETPDWKQTFPPHCLRGTPGQKKIPETALREPLVIEPESQDQQALATRVRNHRGDILFHKHRFDVFSNPNVVPVLDVLDPHDIVLYGVALDVCDKYAIEGLLQRRPQTRIFAVVDAMKPIDRDVAEHLLKEWGEEGVRLVKTSEVVVGGLVEELARASA